MHRIATRSLLLVALFAGHLRGAAADSAGPSAGPDVPAPSECTVSPRTLDEVVGIWRSAAAAAPAGTPAAPAPFVVPSGTPADGETVAAIAATVRQLVACLNAGDYLRIFSFSTDRRLFVDFSDDIAQGLAEIDLVTLVTRAAPLSPDLQMPMLVVKDVRILADGRVGAILIDALEQSGDSLGTFVTYVKSGDRWLMDDSRELADAAGEVATPAA